jgi:hypothetical protein
MAVRFNGSAIAYRTANLPTATSWTICGWASRTGDTNQYGVICGLVTSANNYNIQTDVDGTTLCLHYGSGSLTAFGSQPAVNEPFFFALTSTIVGYARRVAATTLQTITPGASTSGTSSEINVGNYLSSNLGYGWDGRIWNVKAWNRVLTASELLIESYYRRAMFPSSINFHWPLDRHGDLNDYGGNGRAASSAGTLATEDSSHGLWVPRRRIFIPAAAGGTSYTLTAEQGSYALTGQAAALRAARQLAAAQGAYALTGQTAGLQYGRKVGAAQGSYALTGQAAALRAARQLAAVQGAYTLSGQAAGVQYGRKVAAAQGSYALTGQDVALRTSRTILAAQGSYALNGQAAGLIYDAGDEVLTAEPGSYTLTGQAANLRAARTVLAELGTYSLSGQAARLARDARLVLEAGAYALNGQAAALTAPSKLVAEFGVYTLSGQEAVLLYERAAGDGLADPTSRLPSEWAEPPAKRPRHWEPFDLSYFRWKYARDRERVDVVELAPPAAHAFKRSVEDRADEIDEDIEQLEAEIARFEGANARQRKVIGDVEAAIAQVQAVLELAIGARQRQQEELAMILIIVSLLTPGGSRRR